MKKILYSLVAFMLSCASVCNAQNVADCMGADGRQNGTDVQNLLLNHQCLILETSGPVPTINVEGTFNCLCTLVNCNQGAIAYCNSSKGSTDLNRIDWTTRINTKYVFDDDPDQNIIKAQLAGCLAGAFWSCPNPNQNAWNAAHYGKNSAMPPAGFKLPLLAANMATS